MLGSDGSGRLCDEGQSPLQRDLGTWASRILTCATPRLELDGHRRACYLHVTYMLQVTRLFGAASTRYSCGTHLPLLMMESYWELVTGTTEAQLPRVFPASDESNNDSSQWPPRRESAVKSIVSQA